MPLRLKAGERVILSAEPHRSIYLGPLINFVFFTAAAALPLAAPTAVDNMPFLHPLRPTVEAFAPYFSALFGIFAVQPLVTRWLQARLRRCVLTDRRLYLEEGVLSTKVEEIDLSTVTAARLQRRWWQHLTGSGTIWLERKEGGPFAIRRIRFPRQFLRQVERLIAEEDRRAA